jgi:hypothetical protein
MLHRFRRLLGELVHGIPSRNNFFRWEIELMMDFEQCVMPTRRRAEILRQYERAVTRQMETGPGPPMKLSEFLEARERRRVKSKQPGGQQSDTGRSVRSE